MHMACMNTILKDRQNVLRNDSGHYFNAFDAVHMDQDFSLDEGKVNEEMSHHNEQQQQQQQPSTSDYVYIQHDLLDRQSTMYPYLTTKKHELLHHPPQSPSPPSSLQQRTNYAKHSPPKVSNYDLHISHHHPEQLVIKSEHPTLVDTTRQVSNSHIHTPASLLQTSISIEAVPSASSQPLPLISLKKDTLDLYQHILPHYQSLPSGVHYSETDFDRSKYSEQEAHLSRNGMLDQGSSECQNLEDITPSSDYSTISTDEASRRLYALARMVDLKVTQSYLTGNNPYGTNYSNQFARGENLDEYTPMDDKDDAHIPSQEMEDAYRDKAIASDVQSDTNTDTEDENKIKDPNSKDNHGQNVMATYNILSEKAIENKAHQINCICVSDPSIADTLSCGGCSKKFDSICCLHVHLKEHGSGGSYHFDHVSRTAFPKFDTFCSFTQTDIVDFDDRAMDTAAENTPETLDKKDTKIDAPIVVAANKRPSRKCVTETKEPKESEEPSASAQGSSHQIPLSSRKRKQAHPKPSKPLMYMVPLKNTGKKSRVDVSKKRGNTQRKAKSASKPKESDDESNNGADNGFGSGTDQEHVQSKEGKTTSKAESKENKILLTTQEDEDSKTDSTDVSLCVKPFKKRGRPRKCASQIQKCVERKNKVKKTNTKSGKKGRRPKHEAAYTDTAELENSIKEFTDEDPLEEIEELDKSTDADKSSEGEHMKTFGKKRKFQICNICGLTVPQHNYVFHMRQHTGERPFVCEKCGKSFARSRFLTKHLVTHEEVKPWQCPMCPSQFCQKNEYKMHMAGHAGDRPFQCKVCEMRFLSKTSLHTHQANIHMGLTRFECEVCKRRFFKRSSLTVHVATHYEATMKCNFCDRKFRDKTGLKRHERIHTGVKKFKCHICDHAFIQSTPFWAHMEKRHHMDRKMVKDMLHEIREKNRRSGIKTEINVLPNDVKLKSANISAATVADSGSPIKVSQDSHLLPELPAFHTETIVPVQMNQIPKTYAEIKVPVLQTLSESDSRLNEMYQQAFDSDMVSRAYTPHTTLHSLPVTTSELLMAPDTSSAINLCNTSAIPVSAYNLMHQALQNPANSAVTALSHHGFIGLNQLQQAVDFTNSIPHSMAYTDLSDRIIDH